MKAKQILMKKKSSLNTEESLNEKINSLASEENLNDKTMTLKNEDKANELKEIGSLINEIDEMDSLKTNDETLEEDSLDEDKLDDLLKNLDDDMPLDELVNELDVNIDNELSYSEDKKEEVSDFEIKPIPIDSECQDENLDDVIENHDKEKKLEQEECEVEKTEDNKELATIPLVMHNEEDLEDEISKEDEESKNIEEVLKNEDLKTIDELSFFDEYDEVQPHNPPLTALDIEELDDRCDDGTNSQDFKDEELNNYDIDDEFEIKFDECRNQDEKSCETKDDVCKNQGFVGLNDLLNKKENEISNESLKKN